MSIKVSFDNNGRVFCQRNLLSPSALGDLRNEMGCLLIGLFVHICVQSSSLILYELSVSIVSRLPEMVGNNTGRNASFPSRYQKHRRRVV
jgi:hypothetical protein